MLVFEERGKPEFPEKNLSEQSREPTNSAHIWRRVRESNPGHIGGRRALSPLHQPRSPKKLLHAKPKHASGKAARNEGVSPRRKTLTPFSNNNVVVCNRAGWDEN